MNSEGSTLTRKFRDVETEVKIPRSGVKDQNKEVNHKESLDYKSK